MSQHPTDLLIRELIGTQRAATADDIRQIIDRIAAAPFEPRTLGVPNDERGMVYLNRVTGAREDSLFYHLFKRVVVEGQ